MVNNLDGPCRDGRMTTKIHAVVDASGFPVRLALTTLPAHKRRLTAEDARTIGRPSWIFELHRAANAPSKDIPRRAFRRVTR